MLLRVLWPSNLKDLSDPDHRRSDCLLLLGAVLESVQRSEGVITAAIIATCPCEALQQVPHLLQQLSACSVPIPTETAQAHLAVLGTWSRQQSASTSHADCSTVKPEGPHSVWLTLHGSQCLQEMLEPVGRCWRSKQRLSVPCCSIESCKLPEGTRRVQFFVYSVPAQLPGCANVQLPVPPVGPQLPWMVREAGAVSLSAVMHTLQQAHAAVQQHHQQHQHQQRVAAAPRAAEEGTVAAQQEHLARPRTRASTRQSQQQHQQQRSPNGHSEVQGWLALTALLAAAHPPKPIGWLARQQALQAARVTRVLQCLAASSPAAWAAAGPTDAAAAATAAGNAATAATAAAMASVGTQANPLDTANRQVSSCSSPQLGPSGPGLLQVVVQHLLGVLIALNLLLHSSVVLDAAAAAGRWLQHDVLQPHIHWLMQGHPGGIKLHLELSLLMGTAADAYLAAASALYAWSWHWLGPAALVAAGAAAAVGGASVGCVAVADVLPLLLWPLLLAYVLCAGLHRLQLRCLAATWRLIRGKQKVRRFRIGSLVQQQDKSRLGTAAAGGPEGAPGSPPAAPAAAASDPQTQEPSDEVSVEQLIVGVLLFTPLLGLLPTTAAWYLSATWLYGTLHCLRLLLVAVGSWMQLRPLHVLAARWRQPQMFPGQLMVAPMQPVGCLAQAASAGPAAAAAAHRSVQDGLRQQQHALLGSSSSSSRRKSRASAHNSHSLGVADASFMSYYRVCYEPLGYWDVLTHSIAQQQGLLWHVCFGSDSRAEASTLGGVSWVLQWLKDVAAGRVWGLRSLSVR